MYFSAANFYLICALLMMLILTSSSGIVENNWPDYEPNNEGGDYAPNNEGGQYIENWSDDQDNTYNGRTLVWTYLNQYKKNQLHLMMQHY